jgi:glucose/arabinose dehydrogenase
MKRWVSSVVCLMVALASDVRAGEPLTTTLFASGLSKPVMVKSPPGDFQRVFIVQRDGAVRLVKNGVLQATPFIDLSAQVQSTDAERGMLDIAFHPNYASNGYFYLRYTEGPDPGPPWGRTRIKRFTRSANPDVANPASGHSIMYLASTQGFHVGGSIDFGREGLLYVTVGDGSLIDNAQDMNGLYGKILRIDVAADAFPGDPDRNYSIPPGNPFAGAIPGADEIWASGLRNPYRTAFDRITGALWICDVGGSAFEEIDFQPLGIGGRNYGWPCMEATYCWTKEDECSCADQTLSPPLFEYMHSQDCAITGGRMYRGCAIPDLFGTFFVGDFCSGNIWSFRYDNGQITELNSNRDAELDPPGALSIGTISGFGEDAYGEMYICDLNGGEVFKIMPASPPPDANLNGIPDSCELGVGDVDRNGVVNVNDLLAVITSWGPCFECPSDIAPHPTGDGTVNVNDLLLVVTNWG